MASDEKYEKVLNALKRLPKEGASATEINKTLGDGLPTRTLQRWLTSLAKRKVIERTGKGRATKYRLVLPIDYEPESWDKESDFYPPLSEAGNAIRDAIRIPIQERPPVSYNRSFLDDYQPNKTFYLDEQTRIRLKEAGQSLDAEQPVGTYARKIFDRLLIDLSWNSSRLEGNTYSLLETERLLEHGTAADGKNELETQMILNHKAAIELLVEQSEETGFNRYTILSLHALLSENLLSDPAACGRLRQIPVSIGGSVYHPIAVPQQIEDCFGKILETASEIKDPFEQSFFVTVHLPYLQPFEDVNKRVSRLAANIPMVRENLSPLSFVDLPKQAYIEALIGVYELNRIELLSDVFVWAYERSCTRYAAVRKSLGQPDPFKLRNRDKIRETVWQVVTMRMSKEEAIRYLARTANDGFMGSDVERFVEVVETELMSLHEGNIARFRLRPSEFEKWKKGWI